MKTIRNLTLAALLCVGMGGGYAAAQMPAAERTTAATTAATADNKETKLSKAERRRQRKAEEELQNRIAFEQARQALTARAFVLEVDQASFKQGTPVRLSSSKNFISVKGDKGTVQIAFDLLSGGPNGMGGVTLTGLVSNYNLSTDKRGNLSLTMNIIGKGISSRVTIDLKKDNPTATAEVIPNFNSYLFSVTGTLKPYADATVFQGREL